MKLNTLLSFINFVAAKDISGRSMTEDQFNVLLDAINVDLYQEEYNKVEVLSKQQNLPLYRSLYNSSILRPFKKQININTSAGSYTLPNDFQYPLSLITIYNAQQKEIPVLTDQEMNARRTGVLSKPLNEYPAAQLLADTLSFYPKDVGVSNVIEMVYLKTAATPFYDYFIDNTTYERIYFDPANNYYIEESGANWVVKDMDAGGAVVYSDVTYALTTPASYFTRSVELEWDIRAHIIFARRMLEYIGINLKDKELEQNMDEFKMEGK